LGFEEGGRKEDATGVCATDDERSAAGVSREEVKAGRRGGANATEMSTITIHSLDQLN
jgi:hypothetical protein